MTLLVHTEPIDTKHVSPFTEGDIVRYVGSTYRSFTVARCYLLAVFEHARWIVEERNADTHPAADLELVRRATASRPSSC